MKIHLLAVGQRQPAWAEAAFDEFSKRFPAEFKLVLHAVKAEPRDAGRSTEQIMAAEAQRLEAACPKGVWRVVLDEHGTRLNTRQMAQACAQWLGLGSDVALFMGGADGLHPELKARAQNTWRLSDLTLPHALARVVLAEALYRSWTVLQNHPYHRE